MRLQNNKKTVDVSIHPVTNVLGFNENYPFVIFFLSEIIFSIYSFIPCLFALSASQRWPVGTGGGPVLRLNPAAAGDTSTERARNAVVRDSSRCHPRRHRCIYTFYTDVRADTSPQVRNNIMRRGRRFESRVWSAHSGTVSSIDCRVCVCCNGGEAEKRLQIP